MQVQKGQKVKCVGGLHVRYKYGLEGLTTNKEYPVITGFGEYPKDDRLSTYSHTLGENEFEIVDDDGFACWATLASIEDEPLFEVV